MGCPCLPEKEPLGKSHDPLSRRRQVVCTDWICCSIFLVFLFGLALITGFAFSMGDINRIFNGYDCYGNTCGSTGNQPVPGVSFSGRDMSDKPFVFYFNPLWSTNSRSICVKKCPPFSIDSLFNLKDFYVSHGVSLCDYNITVTDATNEDQSNEIGPCPLTPIRAMEPIMGRCIVANLTRFSVKHQPKIQEGWVLTNVLGTLNQAPVFSSFLNDLYAYWFVILGLFGLSVLMSMLMVAGIHFFVFCLPYLLLVVTFTVAVVMSVLLWLVFVQQNSLLNEKVSAKFPLLKVEAYNEKAFLTLAIIMSVLTIVLTIVSILMIRRIRFVVPLFREASRCLQAMPQLLIIPLCNCVLLGVFFAYWLFTLSYISTAAIPTTAGPFQHAVNESLAPAPNAPVCVQMRTSSWLSYLWWYHLVGLVWVAEFLLAAQHFILSSATTVWYFRQREGPQAPVTWALKLMLHHLGSLAFGSFLIAIARLPRWFLLYLRKRLSNRTAPCSCCPSCLEYLRVLSHHAYTVMALSGSGFCSSGRRAWALLESNAYRLAALNSAGDFVLLLGKLFVSLTCASIALVILKIQWMQETIYFFALPVLFVATFAFFTAHCFISLFEVIVDSLFICFCCDMAENDGSPGREFFMSLELKKIVQDQSDGIDGVTRRGLRAAQSLPALEELPDTTDVHVQRENGLLFSEPDLGFVDAEDVPCAQPEDSEQFLTPVSPRRLDTVDSPD